MNMEEMTREIGEPLLQKWKSVVVKESSAWDQPPTLTEKQNAGLQPQS